MRISSFFPRNPHYGLSSLIQEERSLKIKLKELGFKLLHSQISQKEYDPEARRITAKLEGMRESKVEKRQKMGSRERL